MTTGHGANGPLAGIRVVDMSRLAPGPYATMLLADMGAQVTVVGGGRAGTQLDAVARGKQFIALDLKSDDGRDALHRLVARADVFVESFRPGVADKLGAGYAQLRAVRPDLVYCSLTGYGQTGPLSSAAGHDINYIALTGVLGAMGPAGAPPALPLNLVADFAGGSLLAASAITAALYERSQSGDGQYLDVAMIDGVRSMMAMHYEMWGTSAAPGQGTGMMSGAAPFYRCYATSDGRFVAVGALEPQFFAALWRTLGLGEPPAQYPRSQWPAIEEALDAAFRTRTRDEWAELFHGTDACVTPVLAPDEVAAQPHLHHRHGGGFTDTVPPVPRMSRTPARAAATDRADHTVAVLQELGLSAEQIVRAHDSSTPEGLTGWPDM
ncbi:CaiB/BaiF CoA transferase family protein [Gordonia hydrophobica]|uniref:CaiB/BaiF CoA-transferase family protein n=1 Tax=Gordonia hydrophobica TaxID=40516 RepID=A0ABZ2U5X1_9ACTN|nr:CaiB/BaiF CoA-transferase family protein [Gordonia hydrophobica]MBM7368646.1 alpha-methylacyl-CoA racemase [Gordonia hydrophobica]